MTKLDKMVDVLDLFTEENPTLSADEIADRLQISRPTAFRYVKELAHTGFLAKLGSRYALGARIIELDYRFRHSDPILRESVDAMKELADLTACGIFLSRILGHQIFNVHYETWRENNAVTFGRGRPLPFFKGGAAKIVLAHLAPAKLRDIYEKYQKEVDVREIATDWPTFSKTFREIRKQGHYISRGEVDSSLIGISAPLFNDGKTVVGSLSLVFEKSREEWINEEGCAELVKNFADRISLRIANADPAIKAQESGSSD
ncbi:MAG: IclR family transcriptional regulator [Pseudomonadota bacterium]